ncbi:MAG: class I SAM-dependent methyltransferase [Methanomicrobiales archaeon]|nr:class I SAM-dependent methyltransferase [Methanomicrobiales archaeon]
MEQKDNPNMGKKDSKRFLTIADTIFSPIYPVLAEQIVTNTGIHSGTALDVGSGPGHLATALALASECTVHALDCSPDMIEICRTRVSEKGLNKRVIPALGDVREIPYDDNTFDLIVSRGSWFFWEDLSKSLSEIYRVMKPGGKTYIGGGFGTAALKEQIVAAMKERESDFEAGMKERMTSRSPYIITSTLENIGVHNYNLINDDSGIWLMMVRE